MKLHKNISLLIWFNFLLDFRLYSPVAIIYFSQVSGSFALGMSVFSITMLSSALFELPTGIYSDLIGRKKTLVWGAIASLISVVLYAVGGSFGMLAAGGIFEGIARAFYSGNNSSLLVDTLATTNQQNEYAKHLGTTSAMFQWALAASALMGGIIAGISFPLLMWLSVPPAALGLILACMVVEPRVYTTKTTNVYAHLREALNLFAQNAKLRTLSLANIISYASGEAGYQFQSAFMSTLWPVWAVGLAKMLSNIAAAISYHVSGKLIRRYHALPLLLTGKVYSIVSNILATLFPTLFSPLMLSSNSMFHGVETVAVSDLLQKEYDSHKRSTMGSLNSLAGSIAFAIVAYALGFVADSIGPAHALLSLQVLSAFSLILLWNVFKKHA